MSLQLGHNYLGDGRAGVDSRHLMKLAQDTTPNGRYELANAVTTFFGNEELSKMEHHLVVEIMMNLIRRAELDLREALAERLAVLDNVPAEVAIFLANDEISVARAILQHSPVLNEVDLIYIISSKGAEHWQTIAQRAQLGPQVVRRLVDTGDLDTAANLVDNPHITIHRNTLGRLVKISLKAEELQASLLRRPEIDAELAVGLYACASKALRRDLAQRFTISSAMVEAALDTLIMELSQEAKGTQEVTPEMATLAKRFKERGEITPVQMIKTLRRGQNSFFIALFAAQLGLAHEFVVLLLKKDAGKSFAVACRSIGMMKSEFASIYLLTSTIRTGDKTVDQQELAAALKYYDHLKDSDVQRIRKEWSRHVEGV
jgi:uncharacterized protein (DUF2336 family)